MCELQNYIIPHIRAREAQPREDLMSDLVHARLEDDRNPTLSFEEKVSCIRAFLIAGNDTTAAALANLMMILATQPALAGNFMSPRTTSAWCPALSRRSCGSNHRLTDFTGPP